MSEATFNKTPFVSLKNNYNCYVGWSKIGNQILDDIKSLNKNRITIVIECYQGVYYENIQTAILEQLNPSLFIKAESCMHNEAYIQQIIYPDVTDDRVFGYMTRLNIDQYYDNSKIEKIRTQVAQQEGITVIYGSGATVVAKNYDILVYADMARWEIQQRMRRKEVDNLGVKNRTTED